ncbi:HEPN domain-containing protein [Pedobacter insulae]|uniref:HEPN domain-containing protein n=1 Tax=Pedobacter insulae TaxID=414048 RepID=A0A1I3A980_9SPHI|nr:HEPN domain-containing protein [Pedobacter insulae]SFH46460.1 HEPN domain-containing protein [Pedobacter insulae]
MNTPEFVASLMYIAYKDYTGARLLLNNNEILQGLTLASSSVEKYMKAYLLAIGKTPREVHLDRMKELKKQFGNSNIAVLDPLDKGFLRLLGKAYSYRYLNKKSEIEYIGCAINQVLAELDFTVNYFEDQIELYDPMTGKKKQTWYLRAFESNYPIVSQNNYLKQNISKKDFMELPTAMFSLRVNPGKKVGDQLILETIIPEQKFKYNGAIIENLEIRKKGMKP